ncbi:hypothetical protein SCHPADRAFT_907726 [Schizopora paradoxa]|uniref:Uncharacterized protein n=1 Tax=Schizopora paradoxa TaxID=27342 RepID=A0A0H2RD69_9AGAM|nr:hypothetical protein SCHPADRAFT_907726 [Schizopora paradoxa]
MTLKSWFQGKKASRKFIDLIYKSSSKWANWDPAVNIQVGSYGNFDSRDGVFRVRGNIYDLKSPDGQALFTDPPEQSAIIGEYQVAFVDETCRGFEGGPDVSFAGVQIAKWTGRWQFGTKRGAFLVMVDSQITSLPQSVKNAILESGDRDLKNLKVITRVFTANSYSLYLSNKSKELVRVALAAQSPVPFAQGVTVGGELNLEWKKEGATGMFQSAIGKEGRLDYTPLFEVEKIQGPERRRDNGPPVEGIERWDQIPLPWDTLDSDGEEEIDVPEGSDDEDDDF